jgi:TonB family protein
MRVRHFLVLSLLISCWFGSAAIAQNQQSADTRKIVRKTIPSYPEIAKRMNLSGTVRVIATVAPDGTVKSVQPMGGSPVLLQSAQDAVAKWKFASGSAETKEVIELRFDPQ